MLRSYVIAAYRNLRENPLFAVINIVGLGIGLAACLLILLYVRSELAFERWIPDAEDVYVLQTRFDVPGREPILTSQSPGLAAAALAREFPQLQSVARLHSRRPRVVRGERVEFNRLYLVDPTFFDVIPLRFIAGDAQTALADSSSLVLSESAAKAWFGDSSAVGQTLWMDDNVRQREFTVTAIIEDAPKTSDFRFELLGRFDEAEFGDRPWVSTAWTSVNMYTYLRFRPGIDVDTLAKELPAFEERVIPRADIGGREYPIASMVSFSLMPILDSHLHTVEGTQVRALSRYASVMTFVAVALLILFIACINFTNLSTARATQRCRQVALRKVMGATRSELVVQFLGESMLLALLSLGMALSLVELCLPTYNALLDRELTLVLAGPESLIPWLLGLVVLVGCGGGFYPAVYLSRFEPARVLRPNESNASRGSPELRGFLVVVQFAISVALIICTTVVYRQYEFSQSKDLGFDKERLLVVRGLERGEVNDRVDLLEKRIRALPDVVTVTRTDNVPGDSDESNAPVQLVGVDDAGPAVLGRWFVQPDFVETYGIEMVAGKTLGDVSVSERNRSSAAPQDASPALHPVLLNESAVRRLGMASPEDALGRELRVSASNDVSTAAQVVGVVRDFHYKSIREQIRPVFYISDRDAFTDLTVRFEPGRGEEVHRAVGTLWGETYPRVPYRATLLDSHLARLYRDERAQAMVFGAFSVLAIVIACLGLYGLASFTAARRTKEIGIRKVLGATTFDIVRLLVWQFSKPVIAASFVAWPIAAWVMSTWLGSFQYRVALDPLLFIEAGLLSLAIAWLTVGGHAFRFARARPSRALRHE